MDLSIDSMMKIENYEASLTDNGEDDASEDENNNGPPPSVSEKKDKTCQIVEDICNKIAQLEVSPSENEFVPSDVTPERVTDVLTESFNYLNIEPISSDESEDEDISSRGISKDSTPRPQPYSRKNVSVNRNFFSGGHCTTSSTGTMTISLPPVHIDLYKQPSAQVIHPQWSPQHIFPVPSASNPNVHPHTSDFGCLADVEQTIELYRLPDIPDDCQYKPLLTVFSSIDPSETISAQGAFHVIHEEAVRATVMKDNPVPDLLEEDIQQLLVDENILSPEDLSLDTPGAHMLHDSDPLLSGATSFYDECILRRRMSSGESYVSSIPVSPDSAYDSGPVSNASSDRPPSVHSPFSACGDYGDDEKEKIKKIVQELENLESKVQQKCVYNTDTIINNSAVLPSLTNLNYTAVLTGSLAPLETEIQNMFDTSPILNGITQTNNIDTLPVFMANLPTIATIPKHYTNQERPVIVTSSTASSTYQNTGNSNIVPSPSTNDACCPIKPKILPQTNVRTHRETFYAQCDQQKVASFRRAILKHRSEEYLEPDSDGNTYIFHAMGDGHVKEELYVVLETIKDHPNSLTFVNRDGYNPLAAAAVRNNGFASCSIAEAMAEKNINVNMWRMNNGNTIIHELCTMGDERAELLEQLLRLKNKAGKPLFDLHVKTYDDGWTPLHVAMAKHGTSCAYYDESHADISSRQIVNVLLKHDADCKIKEYKNGRTPLQLAIELGRSPDFLIDMCKLMGSDVCDLCNDAKNTLLHSAASISSTKITLQKLQELFEVLIEIGVNKKLKNRKGQEPVQLVDALYKEQMKRFLSHARFKKATR